VIDLVKLDKRMQPNEIATFSDRQGNEMVVWNKGKDTLFLSITIDVERAQSKKQ